MHIENPLAFSFILQEDIFLTNADKQFYNNPQIPPVEQQMIADETETPQLSFNYLGKNKKKFLILTHYPGEDFIAESHLTALAATLKRLEIAIDDAAILNMAKQQNAVTPDMLAVFFEPEKVLILGKSALPAGYTNPVLNSPNTLNGSKILFTYSFDEMMPNNDYKKAFWEQMKQL